MMAFIKDHQTPTIAEAVHVAVGTIIRCDSEILNLVIAATDQTDLFAKRSAQQIVPLIHQINGRGDDECPALYGFDDHLADVTFTCTSRQHDNSSPSGI